MSHTRKLQFLVLCVLFCTGTWLRAAITDGLVSVYRFDETSGVTATDSIRGSSGDGTLNNFVNAPWVSGKFGGAVDLDGVNAWISTPAAIANNSTAMSFCGWVWADSRPTWASIAKNWANGTGLFHFGLNNSDGRLSNYLGNGTSVIDPNVFPTGSWQHVAFTYDGTTHRLYRNGVQVASLTTTTTLVRAYNTVSLGCKLAASGTAPEYSGSPGFWDGKFDDFGFWNRALSAAEIASIYNAGLQGISIEQSSAPTAASFAASPSNVAVGGTTTLAWSTQNATALILNGGPFVNQNVTGQSSIVTPPLNADTTFTLTASNSNGTVTVSRLVGVGAQVLEPVINEFLASNDAGIRDAATDGNHADWIEVYNPNTLYSVDLVGYHLTDDAGRLGKWTFPAVTLARGGYLVVFASGKNITVPGGPLHTNFKLSTEGGYLALVNPSGTIVQQFSPTYPVQYTDVSYSSGGYLATPTPGAANSALAGPAISAVTENPPPPRDSDDLTINATLTPQGGTTVTSATLFYRVMYGSEVSVPMTAAANGLYSAVIPASASTPGQMIRWRITATDSVGRTSRAPLFRDPTNSPQYFGTVVQNASIVTQLPIIHRFVQDTTAIDANPGTRCSIFFNGEFFDNVGIRLRGQTSAGFPKKSHKIEMNSGHRFLFKSGIPRVTEFDLNTTYTDKSYVRSELTSEMQRASGMLSPEIFHVHIRQNGQFYSVAHFVENPDTDYLTRFGLDPDGAYYKSATENTFTSSSAFEKKTRLYESGKADLDALITGIGLTGTALETFVFDNVDLPSMVNYIATTCITQNIDGSNKNNFAYRDTNGSGEWSLLPWDLDLTFGPNALNTDTIVYNQDYASHPFIGARPYVLVPTKYNCFLEAIINTPRGRSMVIRRIRSLVDQFLASNWFQNRIDQLVPMLDPDVTLDHAKWGANAHFPGNSYTLLAANNRIKTEYLTPRLAWLKTGGNVGIPASQTAAPLINFGSYDQHPASGNQDQEYVELINPNTFSVDVSGWTISGGITHTLKPGTVMLPNSSLYLTPSPSAFRARTSGPRGAQRLFVQGNVKGHLSNLGETLILKNAAGTQISTLWIPADPSDAQRYLVISKIMYHPESNSDAEFIELMNTSSSVTLDLSGVKFSAGIDFTFPAGTSLAPLSRILVVKNIAVFQSVYGTGLPIAGEFANATSLSNSGERVALDDAMGSTICELTYWDSGSWPVAADGGGSLVLIAPRTKPDLKLAQNWRVSTTSAGNPAVDDAVHFTGVPNEDADQNGYSNLMEYALGKAPAIAHEITAYGHTFTVPRVLNADDAEIIGQVSSDLSTWALAVPISSTRTSLSFTIPAALAGEPRCFFRVSVRLR